MQSIAKLGGAFLCCLVIVRNARTASRDLSAAELRDVRRGHGQDRKAAANRTASARLRLQVRRLQPDHVGRAGSGSKKRPGAARDQRAGRGGSRDRSHLKTRIPHDGQGFFLATPQVKLRPNFS